MRWCLGLVLLGSLSGCLGSVPPPIPLRPVRFLTINDVYIADTTPDGRGGLARVATVRRRLADTGPILFVLAGDVLSPSLESKYFQGRQMIAALNAARLDYATFGNHEFDFELDTLVARIAESKFKWISSNCTKADGTAFPNVLTWDTLRVSGHKVGLFGITLQGSYAGYVRCSNPDTAAHRVIQALTDEGVDLIVGVTHQTMAADRELLAREPRLDLILGGHDHIALDSAVTNRHVVKADANALSAQFVTAWGGKNEWRQATGLVRIDAALPGDTATARVVEAWKDSLHQRVGPVHQVGTTEIIIEASGSKTRRTESVLGDLVTDAMRAGTGADVAFINTGALRLESSIQPGPVTNYELEAALPFADQTRVISFPISGGGVRRLLEHGLSTGVLGSGGFLQVSGLSFTFDPTKPSGNRIQGEIRRDTGDIMRAVDTLVLAFGAYSACSGGDGYSVPEARPACARQSEAPRALDLLTRYITDSLKGRIPAPKGTRIVQAGNTNPG